MKNIILAGGEYVLGDQAMNYTEAKGFSDIKMPDKPDLWGWGSFYKASGDVLDLKIAAAAKTLEAVSVDPKDVGAVLFCSMHFPPPPQGHTKKVKTFLEALRLGNAYPVGVTLNGCNTLLSAIDMASAMITSRDLRHVLVIAGDAVQDENERFQSYGIFSDAATSCLVTSQPVEGYDIVRSAFAVDPASMRQEAGFSSDLAVSASRKVFEGTGMRVEDVAMSFSNNIFIPITLLKEQDAGLDPSQIYTRNVKRIGHCFSSDPLINLIDYAHENTIQEEQLFMLSGDSPGLRHSILLKARF
jgi:3-oxoacyl-[acyl-carrier-protein] synthase-3